MRAEDLLFVFEVVACAGCAQVVFVSGFEAGEGTAFDEAFLVVEGG